jgi:hypothetical protein
MDAITAWLEKSEPTDCQGVDWSYTGPELPAFVYRESSPYSNRAVVGSPPGLTLPDNPAPLLLEGTPSLLITAGLVVGGGGGGEVYAN